MGLSTSVRLLREAIVVLIVLCGKVSDDCSSFLEPIYNVSVDMHIFEYFT